MVVKKTIKESYFLTQDNDVKSDFPSTSNDGPSHGHCPFLLPAAFQHRAERADTGRADPGAGHTDLRALYNACQPPTSASNPHPWLHTWVTWGVQKKCQHPEGRSRAGRSLRLSYFVEAPPPQVTGRCGQSPVGSLALLPFTITKPGRQRRTLNADLLRF